MLSFIFEYISELFTFAFISSYILDLLFGIVFLLLIPFSIYFWWVCWWWTVYFCLSENIYLPWKDIWGYCLFSCSTLTIRFHCLVAFIATVEKWSIRLTFIPLKVASPRHPQAMCELFVFGFLQFPCEMLGMEFFYPNCCILGF